MNKAEEFEIEIDGIDNEDDQSQRTMSLAGDSDMVSSSRDSDFGKTRPTCSPLNDENDVILTDHETDEGSSSNMGFY